MTAAYDTGQVVYPKDHQKWEYVAQDTHRLRVAGGYIYRVGYDKPALVFVPDVKNG